MDTPFVTPTSAPPPRQGRIRKPAASSLVDHLAALRRGGTTSIAIDLRRSVAAWRRLTSGDAAGRLGPGEPTLVACSGGADSVALLLALASAAKPGQLFVAHIIHDFRPTNETHAERDRVAQLAERLGLPFLESRISPVERARTGKPTNLESLARTMRYRELVRLAREAGVRFIATAHHADDQLETLLMALLRGAGVRGMGGMASSRLLSRGSPPTASIHLVRPLLTPEAPLTRQSCQAICNAVGVTWCEDPTNADTSRLRSALRHDVVPALAALRPSVRERGVRTAEHFRQLADMLDRQADSLVASALRNGKATWKRAELRPMPKVLVGTILRRAALALAGAAGVDRLTDRVVNAAIRAIQDDSTDPRHFTLGTSALVHVLARTVSMEPA